MFNKKKKKSNYVIGVSSGMYGLASGLEEKAQYLTILKKAFWGSMKGVNFTQVDLESITEFDEPYIKDSVKSIKELGIEIGIHGETAATGLHSMPLESALAEDYIRAHDRLIDHIKGGSKIASRYVLIHASESTPFILTEKRDLYAINLVDFWGRSMPDFFKEHPEIAAWIGNLEIIQKKIHNFNHYVNEYLVGMLNEHSKGMDLSEAKSEAEKYALIEKKLGKEKVKELKDKAHGQVISDYTVDGSATYGPERVAYYAVAKLMSDSRDSLWLAIAGDIKFNEDMLEKYMEWVPAVTAKYIWGHFNPHEKKFVDPKPLLAKANDGKGMFWVFEPEMAQKGYEKYMRLAKTRHLYELCVAIGSPWVVVALDFEHMLSCALDPKVEISELPEYGAELIKVVHVGWPTPHIPAHQPIPVGSEAQQYVYERLWELRQKGFMDGWIIFERSGGEDPIKQSVLAIRLIVDQLEKDTPPNELPEEFFGLSKDGFDVKRQEVSIKDHALDPLKGLLSIPEEEHGFLSGAALAKGKGEEWKKRQLK